MPLDEPLTAALASPTFAQPPEHKNHVLQGPLGLRAGWGILVFFLLTFLFGFALVIGLFKASGHAAQYQRETQQGKMAIQRAKAAHQEPPPQMLRVSAAALQEAGTTGAVLLAGFVLSLLERRRFGVYGLGTRHLRDVLPGAAVGLAAMGLLIGVLKASHLLVFEGRLLTGPAVVRFGLEWLAVFVLVGLFEEFVFRGYIQYTLTRGLLGLGARLSPEHARAAAFWMAALLWSLLFSATHLSNAGEDPMGLVMVFVAGILFSYALWRTGSLWWGVGFHMTWDWSQNFLFGVPDSGMVSMGRLFSTHAQGRTLFSGGSVGPEGSVFVIPVLLLVAVVIRLHPQRAQPPLEPESLALVPPAAAPGLIP